MGQNKKMYFIIYIVFAFSIGCKKTDNYLITNPVTPSQGSPEKPAVPKTDSIPANAVIYNLGTGSGNLTIDGQTLKINGNTLIKVKGGTYKTITIKNIKASDGNTVYIKNEGVVKISEGMYTYGLENVSISGDNVTDVKYGFQFENISYRAISMHGRIRNITLRNMSFKNISNYVIGGEKSNGVELAYNGSPSTINEKFKILDCLFDNAGSIVFGGNLSSVTGEDTGLFKDVEIAFNSFINTETGSVCVFSNVQNYEIHHNIVNNINQSNNNHNGVFYMQGNGTFHHNKLTNYQGNAIRMWLYSRGNTPATSEIHNNICHNTRKYGAFELQEFPRNLYPGKSTFSNAKVYNNTVGDMNSSKSWDGLILDLYNLKGTLEYYNNLGYNLYSSNNVITNMINNMSDTKIIKLENNKYLKSQNEAVSSTTNFTSNFKGIGANLILN